MQWICHSINKSSYLLFSVGNQYLSSSMYSSQYINVIFSVMSILCYIYGHIMHMKFCGFTQPSDIKMAGQLGVDAVGLVFYPPSPRAVTIEQAQLLSASLPACISVVALVVNMPRAELIELANHVPFDIIQF